MDPDSAIFVSDLQDVNKKLFFFSLSFIAFCFLKVHLHHFSQTKIPEEVGINVFLTIFA
jgi:hypothetical protein